MDEDPRDSEHRKAGDRSQAQEFWEQHYRDNKRPWTGRANPILATWAGSLPPGRALDLEMTGPGGQVATVADNVIALKKLTD